MVNYSLQLKKVSALNAGPAACRWQPARHCRVDNGSALVELAHQGKRERRTHVLEMGSHFQAHSVPSRITFHIRHGNFGLAQRAAAAHAGRRVVHIRDVLADPVVQLRFQVGALLPRPDVLALNHLDVMRQPAHDEDVGQLRAELVVQLRSEEHTSELQSLMRISYAVFCLKKKTKKHIYNMKTE